MSELRRVVFFGGYRAKIFEWEGKKLLGVLDFEPNDDEIGLYTQYIAENPQVPTALLLDLIEEDFQRDVIPKLNGRDQKAVLERHLDKHYRESEYTHFQIQGPSLTDKNKIDVLLSSLINPEVLSPWLDILKKYGVALTGIYSVPFLSQKVLELMNAEGENVLLVSRQVRSAVRETFFKSGHMYFSRFAKLPGEHRRSTNAETAHFIVSHGTEQVQHFLRNQRIINFSDILNVYAIVYEAQLDNLPQLDKLDTRRINYVSIESLFKRQGLKNCNGQHPDALFSYICSTLSSGKDQYAQTSEKRAIRFQLARRFAVVASSIASIFFISLSGVFVIDAIVTKKEVRSLLNSTDKLVQVYQQNYAPLETQIEQSGNLQKAVQLADYLVAESQLNLQSAFPVIGNILNQPEFSGLYLKHIEWVKYTQEEFSTLVQDRTVKTVIPDSALTLDDDFYEEEEEVNPHISLVPVMHLNGMADRRNSSYSDTVITIHRFVNSIKQRSQVKDVIAVELPVDTREASGFKDKSGTKVVSKSENISENAFQFVVVLNGQEKSAWTYEE